MKKTTLLFSVLLLAVLILLIPAPRAEAAGGHTSHSGYTAWTKTTELPSSDGNYYLTQNVTLKYEWIVTGNVKLCLNGKTISVNTELPTKQAVIDVEVGGTLTLEDCSAAGSGLITCTGSGKVSTAGVEVFGTFYMYGGNIANITTGSCGGLAVFNGGKAELHGGVIHDNKASGEGGGVYVYGGEVYIDGAEICKNEARYGGGIVVFQDLGTGTSGTVTLNRGSIHDNRATLASIGGGGVFVNDHANFSMSGGEIYNNTAEHGGGLYVAGTAKVLGGSIHDNTAATTGGGIRNNGGTLLVSAPVFNNSASQGGGIYSLGNVTMYDCRIEGNTASRSGGGVYVSTGRANVKGRLQITGNKLTEGDASNFYIEKNDKHLIYVMDEMDADADIGLFLGVALKANEEYVLTNSLKTNGGSDGLSAFSCDQREYNVCRSANGLEAIVLKKPVITEYPKDVTAAEGENATFTVKAEGLYLSYLWEYSDDGGENWIEFTDVNKPSLTVKASMSYNGYLFRVHVSNPGYGFFTKTPVKLTVMKKPAITAQPTSVTVANGKTATFKVTATGTSLSYQWQYSADNGKTWKTPSFTSNTASISFEANAARNGLLFHCVVKNAVGSVTSNAARLTVSGVKPAIRLQPTAVTAATGSTATFKVVAAGTGLSYQWQYSADGGKTWHNTSFASNSATVSMEASSARNGLLFHCVVTNAAGSATSSAAKLTVMAKPSITAQPTATTVANGKTATFKITAAGPGLFYQWQYSADNGKTWKTPSFTSNTASISFEANAARNGLLFHCVVKNAVGSVTSSAVRLTVSGVKPAIRLQPTAVTVASGKTATFKIVAAGTGLSYQWQYSSDGGKTWHNTSFASNSATVSMEANAARNGLLFHCVVTNAAGSVTSSSAKLTVSGVKPKITTQPTAVTVASGKTATFKVVAAGTGLSYQWQYSSDGGKTWHNTSFASNSATVSMEATSARNGLLFHCVVKNAYGSVTSSPAKLTVK